MSGQDNHHEHSAYPAVVLASEQVELTSAGIDIGSATSHLMLSRLVLRRRGLALSSGFEVVSREVTYRSAVRLTPYRTAQAIDADSLRAFFDACYTEAGVTPDAIDTGAVIVTGEAARKDNARAIGELFARYSGRFVCAVAGPLLEARLGVQGSGAVHLSTAQGERPLLVVDIGGGTTKVSLLRSGRTEGVMVLNVGARLLAWGPDGTLTRVEGAGRYAAQSCGVPHQLGDSLDDAERRLVASWLADRLFDHLAGRDSGAGPGSLLVAGDPLVAPDGTTVVVSGGVGEYVYGEESTEYGDLGRLLGTAVRKRLEDGANRLTLVAGAQRLRATVIGASQYTVQVSGNTIFVADPTVLPLYNLAVVHVHIDDQEPEADVVAQAVRAALGRVDGIGNGAGFAVACHTRIIPSHRGLNGLAQGIAQGVGALATGTLAILLEQDCAGLLGQLLRPEVKVPNLLCVDQVSVADLDYVDVGRLVDNVGAVPVIAKSLIFS